MSVQLSRVTLTWQASQASLSGPGDLKFSPNDTQGSEDALQHILPQLNFMPNSAWGL